MKRRILAIGLDEYWLTAVQKATASQSNYVRTRKFSGDPLKCDFALPRPNTNTLLLLDASGQLDMEQVVRKYRSAGWKYVIVVAADSSFKQAVSILRRNLGYDYWEKTYEDSEIYKRIEECFEEILADKEKNRPLPTE
jgi:hypothetical protein